MNLILRLLIGFVLAAIVFGVAMNLLHIPPDSYLPAPLVYANATSKAVGVVTKTEDLGYGNHWWSGTGDEYYVDYAFQPITVVQEANGSTKKFYGPAWYKGSVRIDGTTYNNLGKELESQPKYPIAVIYDPKNPAVNGVPNTMGTYSRWSGYMGIWILYAAGLLAVTIIFGEILKRWMPSE